MLKREEFSKEFSLLLQQEIKNFNDLSVNIHKALTNLNDRISSVDKHAKEKIAELGSLHVGNNVEIEGKLRFISLKQSDLEKSLSHNKTFSSEINSRMEKLEFYQSEFRKSVEKSHQLIDTQLNELSFELKNCNERQDILDDDLDLHFKTALKKVENLRQEIINTPSEAKQVKKEIFEKIEEDRIDFVGVNKELIFVKDSMHHIKKHLENLYTQIERLKNGTS